MDWIGLALARYSNQFNAAKLSISGDDITDKGIVLEESPLNTGKKFTGMATEPFFIAKTFTATDVDQQLEKLTSPINVTGDEDLQSLKSLSAEEIDQILAERRKNWKPRETKYKKGVLRLFSQHAASPMKGAYLEY